jgi:sulfopyruvate decarboxylase subunit alpha
VAEAALELLISNSCKDDIVSNRGVKEDLPLKKEAVAAVIEGLKEAGVDFVAYLPDSLSAPVFEAVRKQPSFDVMAVSNESIGVSVCVGAWFGGKVPAIVMPTSGLLLCALHLTSVCQFWGVPILLVIPYRGDVGDAQSQMWIYNLTTEPVLRDLQIPYKIAGKIEDVKPAIRAAVTSGRSWLKTTAVLLTGEVVGKE